MMKQSETTVNLNLAKELNISENDVLEIEKGHKKRNQIVEDMKNTDPKNVKELRELLQLWRINEKELQILWGFELTTKYWKEYRLPHCTCPKMDNDDFYGVSEDRWMNERCPYHGNLNKIKKL